MNTEYASKHKSFSQQPFTTAPKTRRITWHKQQTVKTRCCALQESFYPDTDVPYAVVRRRMITLLGICDRASIVAYLGRPQYKTEQKISHTKKYKSSAKTIPIDHTLRRTISGKLGYIDTFDLGSVYSVKGHWFIYWNHTKQLTLPDSSPQNPPSPSSHSEGSHSERSKDDFSLSHKPRKGKANNAENDTESVDVGIEYVDSSSSLNRRERNCESESKLGCSIQQHSSQVKVKEAS